MTQPDPNTSVPSWVVAYIGRVHLELELARTQLGEAQAEVQRLRATPRPELNGVGGMTLPAEVVARTVGQEPA
jgi:hypothetical protein